MRRLFLALLLLACLTACGDEPDAEPTAAAPAALWTHQVVGNGAVYYMTGPQQARPPEGTFLPGTKVRIVSEHGSYVRVDSETGTTAFVSSGSIRPIQP